MSARSPASASSSQARTTTGACRWMARTASARSRSTTSGRWRSTSVSASTPVQASATTVAPASSRTVLIRRRASGSASAQTMLRAMARNHLHHRLADRWTEFGLAARRVEQHPRDLLGVVPGGDVAAAGERDVARAREAAPRARGLARVDQDPVLVAPGDRYRAARLGTGPAKVLDRLEDRLEAGRASEVAERSRGL